MTCNGLNHASNCDCGWGGTHAASRKGHNLLAVIERRQPRAARFRAVTTPGVRCPICSARVFFNEAVGNGRVFFDSLGPPWPKHLCTIRPGWRWRKLNSGDEIRARGVGDEQELRSCAWLTAGWAPVLEVQLGPGRPLADFMMSLDGAAIWTSEAGAQIDLVWFSSEMFNWDAPAFMRRRPSNSRVIELETVQMVRGAARQMRLVAVLDDPQLSTEELADLLRRSI